MAMSEEQLVKLRRNIGDDSVQIEVGGRLVKWWDVINDLLSTRKELAAMKENLSYVAICWFAKSDGYKEVWRSWRDNMLKQGRGVPQARMDIKTLPQEDIELDTAIAREVIQDFVEWAKSHPHPEPLPPAPERK